MKHKRLGFSMIGAFALITIVWIASYFILTKYFGAPENVGAVGDQFGAVGSLFSGWAFIGVIWAILLQQADLQATLEEMKQTREAHEESVNTLREQLEVTRQQARVQALSSLITTAIHSEDVRQAMPQAQAVNYARGSFDKNVLEMMELRDELRPDQK